MAEDPSYEELYEENLELLEAKEKLGQEVKSLRSELLEGRDAGRQGEEAAVALERVRDELTRARETAQDRGKEVAAMRGEQANWLGERARLEVALQDKEERLRQALRTSEKRTEDKDQKREERRRQTALEREVVETANENEAMRHEVETLNAQVSVLQQALTVAAAERDEILVMRDRSDGHLDDAETRLEAARQALEETSTQLHDVSLSKDAAEERLRTDRADFYAREKRLKTDLAAAQAESAKMQSSTVAGAQARALEETREALAAERSEAERLDAENVELAVLADFLRKRVDDLEKTNGGPMTTMTDDGAVAVLERRLRESEDRQRSMEEDIGGLEAELADDRELLEMAAQKGGLGVAEAIRRNKRLKVLLRDRDREVDRARDDVAQQLESKDLLEAAVRRYKQVLKDCAPFVEGELKRRALDLARAEHVFDDLDLRGDAKSAVAQLQAACAQMEKQIDDLEEERLRLLQRLRDTAMHVSDKGIRFVGLDSEQLELVRTYAAEIRAGGDPPHRRGGGGGGAFELRRDLAKLHVARDEDKLRIVRLEDRLSTARRALRAAGKDDAFIDDDDDAYAVGEGTRSHPELAQMRHELRALTDHLKHSGGGAPAAPPLSRLLEIIELQERNGRELGARLDEAQSKIVALETHRPPSEPIRTTSVSRHEPTTPVHGSGGSVFAFGGVSAPGGFQHQAALDCQHTPSTMAAQPPYPRTAAGIALLEHELLEKLPDEKWAGELRDAHATLAEALEQLDLSGRECADQGAAFALLSGQFAAARQQVAVLYEDHADLLKKTADREVEAAAELARVRERKEVAEVQVENYRHQLEVVERGSAQAIKAECRELARRVTTLEVNELVLKRRYAILSEEKQTEVQRRELADAARRSSLGAVGELEATLRGRILYLELWKQGSSSRVERLQAELGESVPKAAAALRGRELDLLREEHIDLIRDTAQLRADLVRLGDMPRLLMHAHQSKDEALGAKHAAERTLKAVQEEHARVVAAVAEPQRADALVDELARLRGDKSRLEVEAAAARETAESARARARLADDEAERLRDRVRQAEDEARFAKEAAADARRASLQEQSETGTTEVLKKALRAAREQEAALKREAYRLAELASIASAQAAGLARQRDEHKAEHAAQVDLARQLEAKSDDARLIGKLQRELLAVRATYRLFASKYDTLRGQLRRKEAACCKAEAQLDARSEALVRLNDERREQVHALRTALGELSRSVEPTPSTKKLVFHNLAFEEDRDACIFGFGAAATKVADRVDVARQLGVGLAELHASATKRESELRASELARERLEERCALVEVERDSVVRLLSDLKTTMGLSSTDKRSSAAMSASRRLLALSEEIQAVKLSAVADRRSLAQLRDETRRLEAAVAASEDKVAAADVARVEAETRALLAHPTSEDLFADAEDKTDGLLPMAVVDPRALAALALELGHSAAASSSSSSRLVGGESSKVAAEEADRRAEAAHLSALELTEAVRDERAKAQQFWRQEQEAVTHAVELLRAVRFYERNQPSNARLLDDASLRHAKDHVDRRAAHVGGGGGAAAGDDAVSVASGRHASLTGDTTLDGGHHQSTKAEQERLQKVATQTIASLKALVEEKNRALARADRRLEEARATARAEAAEDRAEIEKLTEKLYREHEDAIDQLRSAAATIEKTSGGATRNEDSGNTVVTLRLDECLSELRETTRANRELEVKVHAANESRDRAERRCAEALREIDAQKSDLVALAARLHEAEERRIAALQDATGKKEVQRLEKSLAEKQAKLRGLRQALVSLKVEFVKAEEDRAAEAARGDDTRRLDTDTHVAKLRAVVEEQKSQLKAIRSEARASRMELEKALSQRDKIKTQLSRINSETSILDDRTRTAEIRARELDDALAEARKECRDLRTSEAQLRRERQGHGARASDPSLLADLRREVDVLRAQNEALRSDTVNDLGTAVFSTTGGGGASNKIHTTTGGRLGFSSSSSSSTTATNKPPTTEDGAAQRTLAREQRRVEYLEKMLAKRDGEVADAKAKEKQARDLLEKIQDRQGDKGTKFRRERELENVIAELQRTLHRTNLDNERLRSGLDNHQNRTYTEARPFSSTAPASTRRAPTRATRIVDLDG